MAVMARSWSIVAPALLMIPDEQPAALARALTDFMHRAPSAEDTQPLAPA